MPTTLPNTLHFKLAQTLREHIKQLKPGDPIPTQREFKARFGVSQMTIERALMRLQREGLIHRPAGKQRLVRAETCDPALHRIAIIRPDWPSMVYEGIAQAVVAAGRLSDWAFDLMHYRSQNGLDLARVVGTNDGAVLMLTSEEVPEHLRRALDRPRKPVVVVQEAFLSRRTGYVSSDDAKMARLAIEHLASLGHKRVAILLTLYEASAMAASLTGWRQAAIELGLDAGDELVVNGHGGPFTRGIETAYEAFTSWLKTDAAVGCTAVYCANSEMSLAARRALREAGLEIPRDFSMVGSDAISQLGAFMVPPLTTINMDLNAYGRAVVEQLEKQLQDPQAPPGGILIEPFLTLRESTAAALPRPNSCDGVDPSCTGSRLTGPC